MIRSYCNIDILVEVRRFSIVKAKVKIIMQTLCNQLGLNNAELSLRFVGEKTMQNLNHCFRSIDRSTDVLSFPQIKFAKKTLLSRQPLSTKVKSRPATNLGDIVLCPAVAEKNALSIGQTLDREVAFLLIHGLLHLRGFDHKKKSDETLMLNMQQRLLSYLGNDNNTKIALWNGCIRTRKTKKNVSKGPLSH